MYPETDSAAPLDPAPAPPILTERLRVRLAASAAAHKTPAVSLAVLRGGRITETWSHGVCARTSGAPVGPRTPFRVGSLSKHVTAVAVLRMAEAGLFDIDGALPGPPCWEPSGGEARWPPLTIRQLLGHTSGLAEHSSLGYPSDAPQPTTLELLTGTGPARSGELRRAVRPGSSFIYSGGNYTLLQHLVEQRTGLSFPAAMREWVIEPLGLANSGYEPGFAAERGPAALGHRADGTAYPPTAHPALAAGGLWTTPSDLAVVEAAVLDALRGRPGAILGRSTAREMTTSVMPGSGYGLGTVLTAIGCAATFGHTGIQQGYEALTALFPENGDGLSVAYNSDNRALLQEVLVEFMAALQPRPPLPLTEERCCA